MSGSFVKRVISVTFTLAPGKAYPNGQNVATVSGLRASALVIKAGGPAMNELQLRIWGLSESIQNSLSTLGQLPIVVGSNRVSVSAGNEGSQPSLVFDGNIAAAWADYQNQPETFFHVTAYLGTEAAAKPVPPSSYGGPTDAVVIMSQLATQMGLSFENNGVTGVLLSNPYFPGAAWEQMRRCAEAAGINCIVDDGKLAIWPNGGARSASTLLISPQTGMIGYPRYTQYGIAVSTLFNPSLKYGTYVEVRSSLTPANGRWYIYKLSHNLEAQMPGGHWMSTFEASAPNISPPVV